MVSNTHTCTVIQARDKCARAAAEASYYLSDALQSLIGKDDSISMESAELDIAKALDMVAKAHAFAAAATVRARDAEAAVDMELDRICHNGRRTDAAATKPGGGTPPATLTATLDERDETRKGPTVYEGNERFNVQVSP